MLARVVLSAGLWAFLISVGPKVWAEEVDEVQATVALSEEEGAPGGEDEGGLPQQSDEDRALEKRLIDIFMVIDALREVEVEVRAGVARLSGMTETSRSRDTADRIAGKLPGVVYVQNTIEVEESDAPVTHVEVEQSLRDEAIQGRLTTIFGHISALENVRVRVRSGVVTLSGKALSPEARTQAGELARKTDGVLFVENQIIETTEVADRVAPTVERIRELTAGLYARLPLMAIALLILIAFWYLAKYVTRSQIPFIRRSDNPLVHSVFKQVVRTVIVLVGVLIALDLLGATALVGAVFGAAGLAGLAIGFALRDIVENYLASVLLSMRRPFEPNDLVEIDKFRGKVIRLTTRETVLMTAEGNHLRIPNALVFKSVIYNYTRNPRRRFDFVVAIGPDEDILLAQTVGVDALVHLEGVLVEPRPVARTEELGDSDIKIRFIGWIDQRSTDMGKVRSEAIRQIKLRLDRAEIAMPAPTFRIENVGVEDGPVHREPAPAYDVPLADEVDTGADDYIDRQIEEERRAHPDDDLLKGKSNPGK